MYKINGLEHHHTDVVATLDQDSATIHSVGATTVTFEDHDRFLDEVYQALSDAEIAADPDARRYLRTVKRHILKARKELTTGLVAA